MLPMLIQRPEESPNERLSNKLHFPELDGVRGIAVILVVLYHTFPVEAVPYLRDHASLLWGWLWLGVDLFFVLSGFLITRILILSKNSPHRLRVFYTRRALRIFPVHFLALSVCLWILPFFISPRMEHLQPLWPWFYGHAINIWILLHSAMPSPELLNHFWSLAVEEQFYLFWPFIIFYIAERKLPLVILGMCFVAVLAKVGMAVAGFSWVQIYVSLFTRMDTLALGALSAYAYVFCRDVSTDRIAKVALCLSGGALLMLFVGLHGFPIISRTVQLTVTPIIGVFCSAGIYSLLRSRPEQGLKKFCSFPVLRFFGKYSYGLYIYHYIIFRILANLPSVEASKDILLPALYVFVLANALTLIVSVVSFHAFESKFLKLRPRTMAAEHKNL